MSSIKSIVDMFLQALNLCLENQSTAEMTMTMGDGSKVKITIEFVEEP